MKADPPEPDNRQTPAPRSIHAPVKPGAQTSLPEAIQAETLFKGKPEILLSHNGEHYRLRITRNHKLILTK
jgi:hemin uptake protein HemP